MNDAMELSALASVLSSSFTASILQMYHLRCKSHSPMFLHADTPQSIKIIGPRVESWVGSFVEFVNRCRRRASFAKACLVSQELSS
jgi:hypothetical protein